MISNDNLILAKLIYIDITTPSKTWISFAKQTGSSALLTGFGYIKRTSTLSNGLTSLFKQSYSTITNNKIYYNVIAS